MSTNSLDNLIRGTNQNEARERKISQKAESKPEFPTGMGNALEKLANPEAFLNEQTLIDGGRAYVPIPRTSQRPPTIHRASNGVTVVTRPSGPEYDPNVVGRLILARRLAPVYEGMSEEEARSVTNDPEANECNQPCGLSDSQPSETLQTADKQRKRISFLKKLKLQRRRKKNVSKVTIEPEEWLRTGMIECPICYLVLHY